MLEKEAARRAKERAMRSADQPRKWRNHNKNKLSKAKSTENKPELVFSLCVVSAFLTWVIDTTSPLATFKEILSAFLAVMIILLELIEETNLADIKLLLNCGFLIFTAIHSCIGSSINNFQVLILMVVVSSHFVFSKLGFISTGVSLACRACYLCYFGIIFLIFAHSMLFESSVGKTSPEHAY